MAALVIAVLIVMAVLAAASTFLHWWWRREDKRNWMDEWFPQPSLSYELTDLESQADADPDGWMVRLLGAWGVGAAPEAPSPAAGMPRPHPHHAPGPAPTGHPAGYEPAAGPGLDYDDTGAGWQAIREEILQ